MATEPDDQSRLSDGAKAKIKLRAAYVNGFATAFGVTSVITIPVSVMSTSGIGPAEAAPFAALCLFASYRLHIIAQNVLDGLDL